MTTTTMTTMTMMTTTMVTTTMMTTTMIRNMTMTMMTMADIVVTATKASVMVLKAAIRGVLVLAVAAMTREAERLATVLVRSYPSSDLV
jgi:hypothetical protein